MSFVKSAVSPLKELSKFGQSVWLDYIRRSIITTGELATMVDRDGLKGVTSNPAIFEKAISGSHDYDEAIEAAPALKTKTAEELFWRIAVADIRAACDVLRPVYEETGRKDGYVSIEVSPRLARQADQTAAEALKLWKEVGRENVMIKVPATAEGVKALKSLIAQGVNVNATLLFAQESYRAVAEAYIEGLEILLDSGGDVSKVGSVASFFVSRIDSLVDKLAVEMAESAPPETKKLCQSVIGKVAVANAKLAYQIYLELTGGERWRKLAAKGAMPQRVLWASTSTKNPSYADTIYVDELIGADTVNTIPPATYEAYRDHGRPRATLTEGLDEARAVMEALEKAGISMRSVTEKLLDEGVELFAAAFDKLLEALDLRLQQARTRAMDRLAVFLPDQLETAVKAELEAWEESGRVKALWSKDASIWTGSDEAKWLDWLDEVDRQKGRVADLVAFQGWVKGAGFSDVLLLGMGGSSLCPEVLSRTFARVDGFPRLQILDSTDPAQVRRVEASLDLTRTLIIVASKSGSTLEPNIFMQYFWARVEAARGTADIGNQFVAITDPGSKLESEARARKFHHIFPGVPGIGGRYSALSNFGMVPFAAMGLDLGRFIDRAAEMVAACSPDGAVRENPGVALGAILAVAAKSGRDKVTVIASPAIRDLGAWLEQLLAESTGKDGRGLIPVDREDLARPEFYGKDRLFVYIRLESGADPSQDEAVLALKAAGQPLVRISIPHVYNIGQEFFRWEIATAAAGAILSINPFNQPDVEASKVATRELTSAYEKDGSLPEEKPFFAGDGVKLYSDATNEAALKAAAGADADLGAFIKAHLSRIGDGDYFAILAYVDMNDRWERELEGARLKVRDCKKVATCLGFGPRFLHSTGQAYKGGPNTGVFLQVTCDDAADLAVPGQKYTFGVVKAAQARGDFQVLAERGRRVLRVHLGADVGAGLVTLSRAIARALT